MFPLYDESHIRGKTPWATIFLIILNVALFFISLINLDSFIAVYGFSPKGFFIQEKYFSVFSSMFFHGGFLHLLGNMWFLWVFGDNLEKKLGKIKFLSFYLLCGLGSALLYSFTAADKTIPVIGASGAISGVLGGYLILFPKNKVRALVPLIFIWTVISVPAVIYILIWFLYQILYLGSDPFVAYWGHIGGFLTGILLIKLSGKR
ncbi:MAG: rhomboid family intramembrane serine protease [Candidatus Nealsonbacteria bacterium CG_4_9_14_3_um_filter_35_11]|uniref:Rhomboid family intramembrane serine protease n=2 Tax=Candidatus Nealsoniibacteriota TaxID=1817911 RepID=A0A2M7DAM3_9BACT|nr:MAG: rhomboid family intramembrane serine protease [Candidatus Nealsonbacteria bacterium CG11_big_fil_rev_8_21_14_0_20_35_11]PIV45480.1 MAG: rhomboid family intramembrane serine protease [Candidatus Nealsonbacteria bacterium CG02_land_8_20_14_3_00_34_20]PIW92665.1 MAG: rhomboid family intramembrane serine protease [Candidatus Nealsonbacteria bacterium CG_4_8_14_3_um_filter_34_13]PIZ89980.1 MAG: rhomboid family intramembrane serine protease [Candidatus Nealsonbacteria bacterium CG_4_10_14_0_2_